MPTVNGKSYPYTPEGRAEAKKAAAPKYVQPGIDPNTTAANIAAQQNVRPANTNPPIMKKGPFKLKSQGSSFKMMGSSPMKDDPHTTTEKHKAHGVEGEEVEGEVTSDMISRYYYAGTPSFTPAEEGGHQPLSDEEKAKVEAHITRIPE